MTNFEQKTLVERIRSRYTENQPSDLDALKELDAKVVRAPAVFAYIFGSVAAIIMGAGMSLVMTDIGAHLKITQPLIPGIVIGVAGMILALLTYPIYKGMLKSRKKKYAGRILELSERILNK